MANRKSYPLLKEMSENLDKMLKESGIPVTRVNPEKHFQVSNTLIISFPSKRVREKSSKPKS